MDRFLKPVIELRVAGAKAYLAAGERGYALIDAGMGADGKALRQALARAGVGPSDIVLIAATHAHPDHVGGLAAAVEMTGAPVLCHAAAAPHLRAGTSSPIVPRSALGRFVARASPEWKTSRVEPVHLFEDEFDLSPFGIPGKAVATPGHSADSLSVVLESGDALIGDLVRGHGAKLSWGLFYEDIGACESSVRRILSMDPATVYLSHGKTTGAASLAAFVAGRR